MLKILHIITTGKLSYITALLSGIFCVFGFSPIEQPFAIMVSLIFLHLLYMKKKPRDALKLGFIFGVGFFGFGVSWIFISVHEYGNLPAILAALVTAFFVFFMSLFPAIHGYLFKKLNSDFNLLSILAFATLWTLVEWFRGWILTGFPWLLLGYSQVESIFSGFIPIIGVLGTSFIIVLTSGLCALIIANLSNIKKILPSLMFLVSMIITSHYINKISWTKEINPPIKITVIQGNIPQDLKWSPEYLIKTLKTYQKLTNQHWDSDIIVWPEAAIPLLKHMAQTYLDELATMAKKTNTSLLIGVPIQKNDSFFYNGIILLGKQTGEYYKQFLVPFGEFVPFKSVLGPVISKLQIPMSDFTQGPEKQENLIIDNLKVAPFICYEIAFVSALQDFRKNSNLLVTINNDAWFGNSFALGQHLQIAKSRSLQTGKYQIIATNTGISAIINSHGQAIHVAPTFTETTLTGFIKATQGTTLFSCIGHKIIIIALFLILIIISITSKFAFINK